MRTRFSLVVGVALGLGFLLVANSAFALSKEKIRQELVALYKKIEKQCEDEMDKKIEALDKKHEKLEAKLEKKYPNRDQARELREAEKELGEEYSREVKEIMDEWDQCSEPDTIASKIEDIGEEYIRVLENREKAMDDCVAKNLSGLNKCMAIEVEKKRKKCFTSLNKKFKKCSTNAEKKNKFPKVK